jgi:hypothetical protein
MHFKSQMVGLTCALPSRKNRHLKTDVHGLSFEATALYALNQPREKLAKFLEDKYSVAQIRLSALRSMNELEACQFMQGDASSDALKVNHWVYEFWNINSLIAAMGGQKFDGVSLCLIRDPEEVMASYFVFAVRNGENITILTDREEGPHPLCWRMTRRPDRDMVARWDKNWFPYHLLDLEEVKDADGNVKGFVAGKHEGLVPYNLEAAKVQSIAELAPAEFVWLTTSEGSPGWAVGV